MLDRFNRKITYLRISVTDRCNLRCTYCMPEEGITLINRSDILSFVQIAEAVRTGSELGIRKIRITGGEPLVRKDLPELITMIRRIKKIKEIGMTTNGTLLDKYAGTLKQAGLDRVNISMDTIDPEKYKKITRMGNLESVFRGIKAALDAGLTPVKINFVRIPEVNEEDEEQVRLFCKANGLKIRAIRQMNLATGEFYPVEGGMGGVCKICNRLRLTADGYLKPCLYSDLGVPIREMDMKKAFLTVIGQKPKEGETSTSHQFYNIGG
ncbi:MAG: radical SAM protein [Chlorobi bacterium]|nr:radical SAM protein [Chlorobiota bacterium]